MVEEPVCADRGHALSQYDFSVPEIKDASHMTIA